MGRGDHDGIWEIMFEYSSTHIANIGFKHFSIFQISFANIGFKHFSIFQYVLSAFRHHNFVILACQHIIFTFCHISMLGKGPNI